MRVVSILIRLYFALCALLPARDEIIFLSRQAAKPFDFALLERELSARLPGYELHWECVSKIGKMDPLLVLRQIWHAARARVCLVDGYVPAISIPKRHRALVIQVWHAPGAIKRFGYQALDTPAGRTSEQARVLRMHRGYDYVVAGLPRAVETFSRAFDMPVERIVPLGLPRCDYLLSDRFAARRAQRADALRTRLGLDGADATALDQAPVVLYAPTFRKGSSNPHWMEDAVRSLDEALRPSGARLVVAGHPLDGVSGGDGKVGSVTYLSGAPTIDAFAIADYVVTDYSTVAFEAGFAGKPVLFYVPDIEEYRRSPGLNIDPLRDLPTLSFVDARGVADVVGGTAPYDASSFRSFMDAQMQGVGEGSIERIVDFIVSHLDRE